MLSEQYENFKNYKFENQNIKSIIPKKIHQIWIGPKTLPKKYINWMRSWRELNKDWEYILWTDNEIKNLDFFNQKYYENSKNIGSKVI